MMLIVQIHAQFAPHGANAQDQHAESQLRRNLLTAETSLFSRRFKLTFRLSGSTSRYGYPY